VKVHDVPAANGPITIEIPTAMIDAIATRAAEIVVAELNAGTNHEPPDPWMTTLEAASYLRLSPEALRARARRGTIPVHRDGQRFLFHRDELDSYLGWHGDRNSRYAYARQHQMAPHGCNRRGPAPGG
jgi:excisionase family DNA binding protein